MTQERRARRWCFRDLVVDSRTGLLNEAKIWSNLGKAVMTWGFIYVIVKGGSSEFLWLSYGGIVVAHEAMVRALNQRQQKIDNEGAKT